MQTGLLFAAKKQDLLSEILKSVFCFASPFGRKPCSPCGVGAWEKRGAYCYPLWAVLNSGAAGAQSRPRRQLRKVRAALENAGYFFQTRLAADSSGGENGRKHRRLPSVLISLSRQSA